MHPNLLVMLLAFAGLLFFWRSVQMFRKDIFARGSLAAPEVVLPFILGCAMLGLAYHFFVR